MQHIWQNERIEQMKQKGENMNYFQYENFKVADMADAVAAWLRDKGDDFIEKEELNLNANHFADNLETLAFVLRGRV